MADDFTFDDQEPPEGFFGDSSDSDEPSSEEQREFKEVNVVGVFEHHEQTGGQPTAFVLLRDAQERSVLIWIGRFEALAISLALEGASADRPLTHDLLNNIVGKLGGRVERVLIDDLWNSTYYAKLLIAVNGDSLEIDSRPSDAIALGLRAKAPIYMSEAVLHKAAIKEE